MLRPRRFEADRALRHVENLCFPRRVGTARERRAVRYIVRAFQGADLRCSRQRFTVPLLPREVAARGCFVVALALVGLGLVALGTRPLLATLCWLGSALIAQGPWWFGGWLGARWRGRLRSQNLIARLRERPEGVTARIVFLAHYDTKSQWLPTGVRVGLVATCLGNGLALALVALAAAIDLAPPGTTVLAACLGLVQTIALIALAANVTGNRSPGALDNGSGVGTLLELARTWRPRDDAPVEVLWVATGAEEVGLDGARALLDKHRDWFHARPTLLINLDSVGAGSELRLAGEADALALTHRVAGDLGQHPRRLRVLGAGMDHEPFSRSGLSAVSLLGDVVGASLTMHSARDGLCGVDVHALRRAGELAGALAWAWADRHRAAEGVVEEGYEEELIGACAGP